jgi:sphinganine-1-phosphate aldolase
VPSAAQQFPIPAGGAAAAAAPAAGELEFVASPDEGGAMEGEAEEDAPSDSGAIEEAGEVPHPEAEVKAEVEMEFEPEAEIEVGAEPEVDTEADLPAESGESESSPEAETEEQSFDAHSAERNASLPPHPPRNASALADPPEPAPLPNSTSFGGRALLATPSPPPPRAFTHSPSPDLSALRAVLAPATQPLSHALSGLHSRVRLSCASLDARLEGVPPSSILLLTVLLCTLISSLLAWAARKRRRIAAAGGFAAAFFAFVRSLPLVSAAVAREQAKILGKMKRGGASDMFGGPPRLAALPERGSDAAEVFDRALDLAEGDTAWTPGESRLSGVVYMADVEHFRLLNKVYAWFAHSNPLHGDIFPSVARMEREVVAMTAGLLGGGSGTPVVGCLTSGGTESILTAIRATRDYFAQQKGVSEPEMVVAASAHAAVYKAASYFGIRLVRVPVDPASLQMDLRAVRRAVNGNTILVYASAPGFPHGVVDDVEALAAITRSAGCGLHVDACLGGFVLPFAAEAGWAWRGSGDGALRRFDFSVAGVTSMSVDTHKYGLAQKGSSVLLYASAALRRCQYTAVTEWTGGLYISPSAAGSRPGGLAAQTWASLVHLGREGFVASARRTLFAADELASGIGAIPGLAVLGAHSMIVAWASAEAGLNILQVNDALSAKGWHLNALQKPAALHFCVTPANAGAVPQLLEDLRAAVADVRSGAVVSGGMAPVYGLAGGLPDRGVVCDLLKGVQDIMLDN